MGLIPVPDDHVATIVTALEMRAPPRRAAQAPSPLALKRWHAPSIERYRALFARVGAPWLWFSRLVMDDERLRGIVEDARVEIYAVIDRAGIELGMVELDFRQPGQCELAYLGLVPEMTGKGHGAWVMQQTLALAWRTGIDRLWVHTCTLDHPGALGFYRRHGFVPFKRTVETFPDPRLIGALDRDAAPQAPCLGAVPTSPR